MDQRRLIPLVIFLVSLVMLWNGWTAYNRPAHVTTTGLPTHAGAVPAVTSDGTVPPPSTTFATVDSTPPGTLAAATAPRIKVITDVLRADISAEGGSIVRLELEQHRDTEKPEQGFVILDDGQKHVFESETGLLGPGLPTHRSLFTLPEGNQVLAEGADKLVLRLEAPAQDDVQVSKILTFTRGSYLIDVSYEIRNASEKPLQAQAYFQFLRDGQPAEQVGGFGVRTFTGPAFYSDESKFQKVEFSDIDDKKAKHIENTDTGWVAMVQHYFVSVWLPPAKVARTYFTRKVGEDRYTAGALLPVAVAPGATGAIGAQLYVGPQEQEKLQDIAPGLELVVDYSLLTVIAAPLFWVLSWFYRLTGNWGWAIILVTILIKAIFFPLSAASYKSMAKMRVLGPRMQRMKELYGSDKVKMQQEMMNLYRTEKINPLGGCLPILVQIPVFIALYWVLLGSVEIRHAPWIGWIQDLSARDPYFILPIIMGASMLIQMRLNPSAVDPMQARIMMAMPIIFTVMFLWFPSGLVLYWVVNNVLSIAQQWQITRMIEQGRKPANDPKI
ncbi:membrane protein insertase YidC [Betaproteobacteria bacterium]|nr:membrane protein insertase YidC [Betaproteobacteria bacterium]GHU22317.1 membrane protein insertase YidC [Betaproteobacteria bacterium]GHU29148.1 membrane protein insertase YidC [Betaproteobacteria bacterium]